MRNFGLDLIRAISIWLVLLYHFGFDSAIFKPYGIGGYGVEIFFVLSGFLIGSILLRSLNNENKLKSIIEFWVRRWFRILPLYYLMVLFKFHFIGPDIGKNIFYYIFFLQNHFFGISFYSVTWSLVIEEWFYLIAPIFLSISISFFKLKNANLVWPITGFIISVILLRSLFVLGLNRDFNSIYGSVPLRLDSIFIGVLLALIKTYYSSLYTHLSKLRVFGYAIIFIFLFILFNGYSHLHLPIVKDIFLCLGFTILSFHIALLFPMMEKLNVDVWNKRTPLIRKFITLTSLLTYGIYLIHPIFLYSLRDYIFIFESRTLNLLVTIILTYFASFIVYQTFEKPILMLRDKLTKKGTSPLKYQVD